MARCTSCACQRAIDAALLDYVPESERNQPNGFAGLDAGGLILPAQIPPLAINEVFTVASQAAMLALAAQRGDMAIRTDFNPDQVYVLASDSPGTLADWKNIGFLPSGPAGGVLSGNYPNPGFAVDMATQAELDAVESRETAFSSVAADLTKVTTGSFDIPTGSPSVTFATTDGRPRLLILSGPGFKHTVAQTVLVGLTDDNGATSIKYIQVDLLAGKFSPLNVLARIPAGQSSRTYTMFVFTASVGTFTAAAAAAAPLILEAIRL